MDAEGIVREVLGYGVNKCGDDRAERRDQWEHIGFFANAAVFTLFFTIHTYPHWSERDEAARTLASERRYTVEMISCFDDVWDAPRSQCCCDHDRGRGGEALEPLMGRGGGRVV